MMDVRGRKGRMVKRIIVWMLTLMVTIMSMAPTITVHAADNVQSVENVDFSDFSNWKSGCYNWTNGKYMEYDSRLCLNDYVTFNGSTYRIHIADTNFRVLIRELGSSKNYIKSNTLANGDIFTPSNATRYLAISIYRNSWEAGLNYDAYKSRFAKGFVAELISVKNTESDSSSSGNGNSSSDTITSGGSTTETYFNIDTLDLNDFSNWRSGYYNYMNGKYDSGMTTRICLNKYAAFSKSSYKVSITNTDYHVLIREMDSNMKFVKSCNLEDGATYTPGTSAKYLGISLYKTGWENTSYDKLKQLFANGMEVKITDASVKQDESDSNTSDKVPSVTPAPSDDEKDGAEDEVYSILAKLITTGNQSKVDVSSYKVLYTDFFNEVIPKFKKDYEIELSSGMRLYANATMQGQYIQSVWIENLDSDYLKRLDHVRKSIDEYLGMTDARMSDLEKVLLAHEYIINHTYYKNDNTYCHYPAGPLGEGYGVCDGYALSMALLLKQVGLETNEVRSSSMNHAWLYVKLDGAWYHIDPTWDDTQKGTNEQYIHRFLIRNDEEFRTIYASRNHYGWVTYDNTSATSNTSNSTKYTDWFVHDVAGSMYYNNGMWYYWDINTNSVMCSTIEGNGIKVIVDGSGKDQIKLKGIESGYLIYTIGNTQYTKSL